MPRRYFSRFANQIHYDHAKSHTLNVRFRLKFLHYMHKCVRFLRKI